MSILKKLAMWIGIFIGSGLCFLAVLYLTASLLTYGLKKPIEKQLVAIRAEDAASAYAYTSSTFQDTTSFEAFKKFINAYSALRNNESISFDERSINDGVGIVYATLKARSKATTPALYRLIKENGDWKIESMVLNPSEETRLNQSSHNSSSINVAKNSHVTDNTHTAKTTTKEAPVEPITNVFQNIHYNFSMGYPDSWQYSQPAAGLVVFTHRSENSADQVSASLQTLATYGHRSVQKVVDELSTLLYRNDSNVRVIEDALIPTFNGKIFQARFVLFQYTKNNQNLLQLNVIYFKKPSRALYFFEFIAPADQFDTNISTVKAMVETFATR